MKKYIIFMLISVFGLIGFSYAADCSSLISAVGLRQQRYNNCMQQCAEDKMIGIEPPETDCLSDICYNEKDNLEVNQTALETCQSNNGGGSGGAGGAGGSGGAGGAGGSGGAGGAGGSGGTSGTTCTGGSIINGQCVVNNAGNMGIDMDSQCLINGQCKFDIYQTLGIRQSLPRETRSSPGIFVQDIILSATFFVGTLITGVLIISGLLFVFSGVNAGLADKAKKGITGSLVGLLFVVGSYAFVRLIQFLVTGGGG